MAETGSVADSALRAARSAASVRSGRSTAYVNDGLWSTGAWDITAPQAASVLQMAILAIWRMIVEMPETEHTAAKRQVWNAGRTVGAKRALKPKQIWEIRFYLDQGRRLRDRALFDLAIDSKLRGCDLVQLKVRDLVSGGHIRARAIVMQQKTGRPVQFELLPDARACLLAWLERRGEAARWMNMSFPARFIIPGISAPANMPGLSMNG